MKDFLGYLLFLIASYLFCIALALVLSHCFNLPEPTGVATLVWGSSVLSWLIIQFINILSK